jgi:HSP20 family protein
MTMTSTNIAPQQQKRETPARSGGEAGLTGDYSSSLDRIRDEFDRLFDRMTRQFSAVADFNGGSGWRWGLQVDDQADAITVRAEAPGYEAGDFDIRVQDNRLVMRAAKKVETRGEKGKIEEYREQSCYESITLPSGIDREKIDAKYHNGILTVIIPKTAEGKGKKVAVKAS